MKRRKKKSVQIMNNLEYMYLLEVVVSGIAMKSGNAKGILVKENF